MQRSRRGYKLHRPRGNRHSNVQHVRVTSRTQAGTVWASSLPKNVSEETLQALDGIADAAANMTPEQLEDWREKIKRDK